MNPTNAIRQQPRWLLSLALLLASFSLTAQNRYDIACENQGDSLRVALSCKFDGKHAHADYLLLSPCCHIRSSNLGQYTRQGDTLRFKQPIAELQMDYSIPKSFYTTSDDAVILRREGNWYPHRNNELLTALLTLDDTLDHIICGQRLTERDIQVDTAFELHLLLLPKERFSQTIEQDSNRPFYFYRSIDQTTPRDQAFYAEFTQAYDFFSDFFGDKISPQPMAVVEISDPEFQMCQSLPDLILFGSMFYQIFTLMPTYSWIPHEMAHQWWGNRLFFEHLDYALGESVNEYLKLLFLHQRQQGFDDQLELYQYNMSMASEQLPPIADIHSVQEINESIAIYSEAPFRLWNAVSQCPDSRFSQSLSALYRTHKHTLVDRRQFLRSLSQSAQPLFTLWLQGKE